MVLLWILFPEVCLPLFFSILFQEFIGASPHPTPPPKNQVLHGAGELSSCHQDMQPMLTSGHSRTTRVQSLHFLFFGVYLADISTGPSWLDQGLLLNSTQSVSNLDQTTSATVPQSRYVFFQGEKSQPQSPGSSVGSQGRVTAATGGSGL